MTRARARLTDALARRYLARVTTHARHLARRLPAHIALSDLISAGLLGVVEGFLRFDPNRPETLDAFLDQHIRGALLDELRRADPLTRAQRGFVRRLDRASSAVSTRSSGVCDELLAVTLGLSVSEFRTRVAVVHAATVMQGTDGVERAEDDAPTPDSEVSAKEEHELLSDATRSLPARERDVLRLHYEEAQTFREIGAHLGVSESRVSQIHTSAVKNLRSMLSR